MHDYPAAPWGPTGPPALRDVFDSLFAFVAVLDTEGRIVEVNRAPLESAGLAYEDVHGQPLWESRWWSYAPQAQAALRVACVRALGGRASRYDAEARMAPGRLMTLDLVVKPLRDAGDVTHIVVSGADVTDRRRSEEERRRAAELLKAVAEQTGDLIIVKDAHGRVMMANPAALEAIGRSAQDVLGRTEAECGIDPAQAAQIAESDARVIATGRPESVEERRPRWGEVRTWLATKTPYRDNAGNVLGVITVAHDVTERQRDESGRKRLLETLSESAARAERKASELEAVLEAIDDGVVVFDVDGVAVFVNDPAARLLGHADREAAKRDYSRYAAVCELRETDGAALAPQEWPTARILRGASVAHTELRARRKDTGQEWLVRYSGLPLRDEQGRQNRAMLMMRDITAARRTEHSLRASAERTRLRAESLQAELDRLQRAEAERKLAADVLERGQPVYVLDAQFRYVLVNERHEQLSGVPRSKLLGRLVWDVFPEAADPQSKYRQEYGRVMRERTAAHFEAYYQPLGMWASIGVYPVGQDAIAVFLNDVGERRRNEEALREADQQKDAFIAMLSHELRNPLSPIVVATHILQSRHFQDAVSRGAVEILLRQSRQMGRLLDDLLDVARITRNRLQLQLEVVDLVQCVQDAVHSSQELIGEKSHELSLHLPQEPVLLKGDPVRLTQVVTNLLNNAAKYSPPRSKIDILLKLRHREVVLSVMDDGPGVPPEKLARIFSAFYTGAAPGHAKQGLGIGLWLTHRLVEMHGGTIEVANGSQGGARFTVHLPAH